jgi:hypothetical protein
VVAAADPSLPVIDDFEDANGWLELVSGRAGVWYVTNDGSSDSQIPGPGDPLAPVADGAGGSGYSGHTVGSGFTGWGSALGVPSSETESGTCRYDARALSGIAFRAKGLGSATLSQAGWGATADFDPSELIAIEFGFAPDTTFELFIDDLSFVE